MYTLNTVYMQYSFGIVIDIAQGTFVSFIVNNEILGTVVKFYGL